MVANQQNDSFDKVSFASCVNGLLSVYNMFWLNDIGNLEIFARVLFSRNFAYAKFHENENLTKSHCQLLI